MPERALILGAAGRDFHNFNTFFRDNPAYEVVAFTATQIPNIADRVYPPVLAGPRYPRGIPIFAEADLERLIDEFAVDVVVFSYSDVSHEYVMHLASRALAAGADYLLLGTRHTALRSRVPVVAVCAARTGSGKSQTSRRVAAILGDLGQRVVVVRHPMPYGDLARQAVQRFATYEDLAAHDVTIEEREEYEPHLAAGRVVYAGVDYEAILRQAETEADVVIWDGGNNDLPFYAPDLHLVVVDPHRAGHAMLYHPGEANVRMADAIIINKVDTATAEAVALTWDTVARLNPRARIIKAASPITLDDGPAIRGRRVLVIEDGPTLTHGGMKFGAGWVAAEQHGAGEIVDPRPYAVGSIAATFAQYPNTGAVLPAMGYSATQVRELADTIARVPADLVIIGTPIDLRQLIRMEKPAVRVRYDLAEEGPGLVEMLAALVRGEGRRRPLPSDRATAGRG
ncbi:MAG TPA: cyclic 2,3-diphosphoglycerate synthase [Gemmatimonadales bacterium]